MNEAQERDGSEKLVEALEAIEYVRSRGTNMTLDQMRILARQLIEERDKYKTLWEDRKRLVDEENERLKKTVIEMTHEDVTVQQMLDLQTRLSAAEELASRHRNDKHALFEKNNQLEADLENAHIHSQFQGAALEDLQSRLAAAEEENESLRVAFEEELECCKQRGEQLKRAEAVVEAARRAVPLWVNRELTKALHQYEEGR